jgi:hypothetical protein
VANRREAAADFAENRDVESEARRLRSAEVLAVKRVKGATPTTILAVFLFCAQ